MLESTFPRKNINMSTFFSVSFLYISLRFRLHCNIQNEEFPLLPWEISFKCISQCCCIFFSLHRHQFIGDYPPTYTTVCATFRLPIQWVGVWYVFHTIKINGITLIRIEINLILFKIKYIDTSVLNRQEKINKRTNRTVQFSVNLFVWHLIPRRFSPIQRE